MIVWVNGSFGSGKTTLVAELHRRWPETLVFDPEDVGVLLSRIVGMPTGDFQDLPLWRRQVVGTALGLLEEYRRPLLVPMTLVDPDYSAEVFGGLAAAGVTVHQVFLKVPAEVLERRVAARGRAPGSIAPEDDAEAMRWVTERITRCVAAVDALPADAFVLDGERPCAELAAEVLARVGAGTGAEGTPAAR